MHMATDCNPLGVSSVSADDDCLDWANSDDSDSDVSVKYVSKR